jgi:hypothetical protein
LLLLCGPVLLLLLHGALLLLLCGPVLLLLLLLYGPGLLLLLLLLCGPGLLLLLLGALLLLLVSGVVLLFLLVLLVLFVLLCTDRSSGSEKQEQHRRSHFDPWNTFHVGHLPLNR